MKKYLLLLFVISYSHFSQAQNEGCDGIRYIDDVFTEIKVTTDLKYGEGETIFGNFKELYLDVYEPANDELERRPVIILAFGGSYIAGEREDLDFLCMAYALKGYVVVTIDYRLFDGPLIPLPTATQMKNVVIKSVSDMKAAIRYMRLDADTDNMFRIDSEKVFVGGISAGSITAFHTAMLDNDDEFEDDITAIIEANGGLDGNTSENLEYSSEVQGLVNFSGGLNDASWIDENDPPFVSVHDDMDGVVPYGDGFAKVFGIPIIYMEGSNSCHAIGDSVGLKNQLKTIENSMGHVSYLFNPADIETNVNFTAEFVAEIVCAETTADTEYHVNTLESVEVYPNPTNGLVMISEISDADLLIEVFDIFGRKLMTYSNEASIDLSNNAHGIYFLRIKDMKSASEKIVKLVVEG